MRRGQMHQTHKHIKFANYLREESWIAGQKPFCYTLLLKAALTKQMLKGNIFRCHGKCLWIFFFGLTTLYREHLNTTGTSLGLYLPSKSDLICRWQFLIFRKPVPPLNITVAVPLTYTSAKFRPHFMSAVPRKQKKGLAKTEKVFALTVSEGGLYSLALGLNLWGRYVRMLCSP